MERLIAPKAIRRKDQVASYEGDLIARTIRRALEEKWPVPRKESEQEHGIPEHALPGDFLIVTRGKPQLTQYARKLQQYGIPHLVTGGHVLNEVPELELLHLCLNAVARSYDPVALVAVLRSELFGLADTVLYDFHRHKGRFSYHSRIPKELPEGDAKEIEYAFEKLKTFSRWLHRLPAASAVERIAADLGLIARACACEEGNAHAGSLLKAIELLRNVDGPLTAGDVVEAISNMVNKNVLHDGVPVRPSPEMPVRVMNLHQCKGLEAPFVFLVDPSGESNHDVSVHIDRSGDEPRGYLPIYGLRRSEYSRRSLIAHPQNWDQLAEVEQRFLDAENNRLLYVAATRAGVKLVISQREGNPNNKNPWRFFDNYLQEKNEFEDPGTIQESEVTKIEIDRADWDRDVKTIENRWQAIVQPTYAIQAIKESAISAGPKPVGKAPDGVEWGIVLHTVLQAAIKQPEANLAGLARSALENEGLSIDLTDDVVATVEGVTVADFWQRAQRAKKCLAEVPLMFQVCDSDPSNDLPTLNRGVIDLVFEDENGWVIVDYKSDRVEAAEIPELVRYYQPQVEAYTKAWEKVTGQSVVESALFFTHSGKYVPT